ncbi:hypothetical protein Ping_2484 [Psychromonas ingrahamii 37]|uniref:Uncharacterized protein n=1 Tax=Psychromonas ingrahamii (strain DSM 17664 / CCUG 51855 / 37) TaxID=357804 RepID=A1SXJ8_PSYIN|nr:hypothetical protein [Psychromonas ingrahamii]ABM04213.1 hypothetical protein Ping_2484 [Psychromonas ingrahamii 37]
MLNDWEALTQRFINEHARNEISVKAWCQQTNINYASARRHIKVNEKNTQYRVRKLRAAQNDKCALKKTVPKSYKHKIQSVNENKSDTSANTALLKKLRSQKRVASLGNQNARKFGHYSTFLCTDEDVRRYLSASTASLRDELNLVRILLLHTMVIVKQIDADLKDDITAAQKTNLQIMHDKFHIHEDNQIARIESLEMSLLKQEKMKVDTEKTIILTNKFELQIDKLNREVADRKPIFDEIYCYIMKFEEVTD